MYNRPKIGIITNTAWNVYNFRLQLARDLQRAGYEVCTMAAPDDYADKVTAHGVPFIPLRWFVPSQMHGLRDIMLLSELYRNLRRERPALLLLYTAKANIFGNMVARQLGIPTITTMTGIGSVFLRAGFRRRFFTSLYRRALRHTAVAVFHNADDRAYFVTNAIVESEKSQIIPGSGIDVDKWRYEPLSSVPPLRFLLLSRLLKEKGIVEFLEASRRIVAAHRDVEFYLAGDRPNSGRSVSGTAIEEWSAHPRCHYLGFVSDVEPLIRKAHVVVAPSWREGMPRTVLEAMAKGRMVLATDVPGCRQAVEHGKTGLLVHPRDSTALQKAMEDVIRMPHTQRIAFGIAGRKRVEAHFSHRRIARSYLELIERVLAHRP